MKIINQDQHIWLILSLICFMTACPDPSPPKPTGDGDMSGGEVISANEDMGGDEQVTDMMNQAQPEMSVEMDMEVIPERDMELDMEPDMELDMEIEPIDPIYEGDLCDEENGCGTYEQCLYGICRFDLRPTIYRMREGWVYEPMGAAPLLQVALNTSINQGVLNLLFEPGFYTEEGKSFWFIGNGLPMNDGYTYRRNFPIQNFTGEWRRATDDEGVETPKWFLDGEKLFILAMPTGFVVPQDQERFGDRFQCTTTFPTTVRVTITPEQEVEGGAYNRIRVDTNGYLKRSTIEQTRILYNGLEINFIDYFEDIPLEDMDGDGLLEEYPFHLEVEAIPVSFLEELARPDRLDLRDPTPDIEQPAECSGM